jgi:hypothetical protein
MAVPAFSRKAPSLWERSTRIFHRRCLRRGGSRRVWGTEISCEGSVPNGVPKLPNEVTLRDFACLAATVSHSGYEGSRPCLQFVAIGRQLR